MRIDFRQGIISYPTLGNSQAFLTVVGNTVSLRASSAPVQVAFAQGSSDYLYVETSDVDNAWAGLPTTRPAWLYWDIDTLTGVRTFGYTVLEPIITAIPPTSAEVGQMVFDLSTTTMYEFTSPTSKRVVIRAFAAVINGATLTPLGSGFAQAPYAGTQVGLNVLGTPGQIIADQSGLPIRRRDGTLLTTENDLFVNGTSINPVRLDATVVTARAAQTIARYQVVKFSNFGEVELAQYDDIEETAIAMSLTDVQTQQIGTVCLQGKVTNPSWNWPTVGAKLWVSENGILTDVDPHVANAFVFPIGKPPVGRVISEDTIIFDQGLGGKGERGAPGLSGGVDFATPSVYGVARLSVPAADAEEPVVVGTNDPRLTDKVFRAGDTMTGPLVLSGNPITPLQAATKQYVDGRTLESLSNVADTTATVGQALVYNGTQWAPSSIGGGNSDVRVLDDLDDVTTVGAASGMALLFNGTQWSPSSIPVPPPPVFALNDLNDVTVNAPANNTVLTFNSTTSQWGAQPVPRALDDLSDVNLSTPPTINQVLTYNGTSWIAGTVSSGGGNPFDQDLNTFNNVRFVNTTSTGVVTTPQVNTEYIRAENSLFVEVDTNKKDSWITAIGSNFGDNITISTPSGNGDFTTVLAVMKSQFIPGGFVQEFGSDGTPGGVYAYNTANGNGNATITSATQTGTSIHYASYTTTDTLEDPSLPAGVLKFDFNFNPGTNGIEWRTTIRNTTSVLPVIVSRVTPTNINAVNPDVFVAGSYQFDDGTVTANGFVARISNVDGSPMWTTRFSMANADVNNFNADVVSQQIDSQGNVVVAYRYDTSGGLAVGQVVKLDGTTGALIFSRAFSGGDLVMIGAMPYTGNNISVVYRVQSETARYQMTNISGTTGETIDTFVIAPVDTFVFATNTTDELFYTSVSTDGTTLYMLGSGTDVYTTGAQDTIQIVRIDHATGVVGNTTLLWSGSNGGILTQPTGSYGREGQIFVDRGVAFITGSYLNSPYTRFVAAIDILDQGIFVRTPIANISVGSELFTIPTTPALFDNLPGGGVLPFNLTITTSTTDIVRDPFRSFEDNFTGQRQQLVLGGTRGWEFTPENFVTPGYTLPNTDGLPGQALVTDGGGVATWGTPDAPYATFVLRSIFDTIETYTNHIQTATMTYGQALQLIRQTLPTAQVADPYLQPFVDLVTNQADRRVGGGELHTHTIRVYYDYKRAAFFVSSVSDNGIDSHAVDYVGRTTERKELRMLAVPYGQPIPAAGTVYRTVMIKPFAISKIYVRTDVFTTNPIIVDVTANGSSITDSNGIFVGNFGLVSDYTPNAIVSAPDTAAPLTLEVQVIDPAGGSGLEVIVEYYEFDAPFISTPPFP